MADASFGHQGRLTMVQDTGDPANYTGGRTFEFVGCTLAKHGRHVNAQGISGTRSARIERVRQGPYSVFGSIILNVGPADFDFLLPLIMGAGSDPTFTLAEDVLPFAVTLDTDEDIFEFTDLKVDTAIFRGQQPGMNEQANPDLMTLELRCIGKTFSSGESWPGTAPALDYAANTEPYILADFSSSIQSVAATPMSFAMVVNNFLNARFVNSLTATSICPADTRFIGCRIRVPWNTTHAGLLEPSIDSGGTSTVTFTNGTTSTLFTFGRMTAPNRPSPLVRSKGELFLERDFRAYRVSSTNELEVTNDMVV